MAGQVIGLKTGETITFGWAAGRAQFALPHDTFMSGVHFAVECGPGGCRVQDRKSSNGTFLNGARIRDAMLANGDEIKGGGTIFAVKIVPDAKIALLLPPEDSAEPVAPSSTPAPQPRAEEAARLVAEKRPEPVVPQAPSAPEKLPLAADHLAAVPRPPVEPTPPVAPLAHREPALEPAFS